MKKLLILLFVCISLFAEEFTWANYETLCFKNNKEPSYEEYVYLVENPQCYYEEDFDFAI